MVDVLKYIHENIAGPLKVDETAERFGYSKWYFCKKFHKFTGTTFSDYVRHLRIQLAAMDILQGRRILDVALSYGYDSVGGFNKAFLREYGCFPREYRKQAAESTFYYERRRATMYQLTDRCAMLREEAVNRKRYMGHYLAQREIYYRLGAVEAQKQGLSKTETVAHGIARVLESFTPVIIPGEMIVGFNYGIYEHLPFPPSPDDNLKALFAINHISDEDRDEFFRSCTAFPRPVDDHAKYLSREEREADREWAALARATAHNHSVIDYEKVLKLGFEGLLEEVDAMEKKHGDRPMYRAFRRLCEAACHMGEKYAEEAEKLLNTQADGYDPEDLHRIAHTCRRVPRYPAENFTEAVQSLWFAHIINTWEDYINANSLGRLDQILYPYYQKDIESGVITKERAFETVCCLWIKLYRDYDVQQSCVGGTDPDGTSAVNDLSYMMLDATEALDLIRCLSVRFSSHTEKAFLKRALEVVGHLQKGVPFFFNDDVMIPALMSQGIAKEDAFDYTQIGCVETVIPGRSNPHAVTGETNLLKAMEYVLENGHSMMDPTLAPGLKTGEIHTFTTYAEFYKAVIRQIDRILDLACSQVKKTYDILDDPMPYKSLLTDGCAESGNDFNARGARYDYYQIMIGGVPNLADSLAVIKKFVYEDKKYTLAEIKDILENDFPDEAVRLEFVNKAPKFGNDIDEVDDIATALIDHACDTLQQLSRKYGYSFHAQPFTYLWMIDHGRVSAASPDGRRKGEPIAYSVSPMNGRDFNGLTAVLNSIAKLPTKRTPGTTSAIIEVDPKLFTDKNIDTLTDILIAAGKRGLSNVQFNTIDAETLMDAKNHPDRYNNLAVRVSGFSQKFNLLSPELQDHIIGRTKHVCL